MEAEIGEAFIYVEGVNFNGISELAGCSTATIAEPSTSTSVTLQPAGSFDCSDPTTEDGAPCDDGEFCTVGETCRNGTCQGGNARSCSALASDCVAATCSETEGCQAEPVQNGTACDDGFYCTSNDTCQEGQCIGTTRDCSALAGPCREAAGCDELAGECIFTPINEGLTCDDGMACTNAVCNAGECILDFVTPNVICSDPDADECNVPTCSEDEGGCYLEQPDGIPCAGVADDDNECTEPVCNGAGDCVNRAVTDGEPCDGGAGQCEQGTCTPL